MAPPHNKFVDNYLSMTMIIGFYKATINIVIFKICNNCFQQHISALAPRGAHQPSIESAAETLSEKGRAAVKLGLRTCYWVVSEELPNTKFRPLLGYLRAREVCP